MIYASLLFAPAALLGEGDVMWFTLISIATGLALGADLAAWDRWLADDLAPAVLATKPFTPLPVLGVPGWWAANEEATFYDDPSVFRAPRV